MFGYFTSKAGSVVQGLASKFKLESDEEDGDDEEGKKAPAQFQEAALAAAATGTKSLSAGTSPAKGEEDPTLSVPSGEHSSPKGKLPPSPPAPEEGRLVDEMRNVIVKLKEELRSRKAEEEKKEALQQEVLQQVIGQRELAQGETKKLKARVDQMSAVQRRVTHSRVGAGQGKCGDKAEDGRAGQVAEIA